MPIAKLPTAALTLVAATLVHAQEIAVQRASEPGSVDRVTVYPSGAAVTRTVHRDLAQGLWELRVTGLPPDVDPSRIQAKVREADVPTEGAPALLGVEYDETPGVAFAGSAEGIELATKLADARTRLGHAVQDAQQLEQRIERVEQVAVRIAANATAEGGTAKGDAAKALAQLGWANDQRTAILADRQALAERTEALKLEIAALESAIVQRGQADRTERAAVVRIAVPRGGPVDLDVTYMVGEAGWAPAYAVRAAGDRSGLSVEYDALVQQRSGEPWDNVRVSLSTADPENAAQPGEVEPVWVDVARPPETRGMYGGVGGGGGGEGGARRKSKDRGRSDPGRPGKPSGPGGGTGGPDESGGAFGNSGVDIDRDGEAIERFASDASLLEAGIAATFELPRRINVPSDAARVQRTRIATIEPSVKFVHVAQPLVDQGVYLRGDLVNTGAYQLLPGTAQVFMGGDLIGDTAMPAVAPKSAFKVFFGPDRAVRATREVLSKITGTAGLFGGSTAVTWRYRVTIDNGTGRDLALELVDRRPMSRNAKIEVKVADPSAPLSTAADYLDGPQKSGILRWDLTVPAAARGNAALPVTWTVRATHAKDVQTTPLPD